MRLSPEHARLLASLATSGREMTAKDLADLAGTNRRAAGQQMSALHGRGLVAVSQRKGRTLAERVRVYSLTDAGLGQVVGDIARPEAKRDLYRAALHDLLTKVWETTKQAGLDSPPAHFGSYQEAAWLEGRDDTVEYVRTEGIDPLRRLIDAGEFDPMTT